MPALARDFLAALVAYLTTNTTLATAMGATPRVFTDRTTVKIAPPFLVIEKYSGILPGETLEDHTIEFSLVVYGATSDTVLALLTTVYNVLDSVNENPGSERTTTLVWTGGAEVGPMRGPTGPPKQCAGFTADAGKIWRASIEYEFLVAETPA